MNNENMKMNPLPVIAVKCADYMYFNKESDCEILMTKELENYINSDYDTSVTLEWVDGHIIERLFGYKVRTVHGDGMKFWVSACNDIGYKMEI